MDHSAHSIVRVDLTDGRCLLFVQWLEDGPVYPLVAKKDFIPIDELDLFNKTEPWLLS